MALETLKGITKIGDSTIYHDNTAYYEQIEKDAEYIGVCHKANVIAFKLQNGPIKEVGINGCQVDSLVETAKLIIEKLNEKFPCRENSIVITKLDEALMWLDKRKKDREKRNVEGTNKL